MRILLRPILLCAGSMLAWSAPLHAEAPTPGIVTADALSAAASALLQSRARSLGRPVHIRVDALDPRLRLAECSRPLETAIAGDGELHEYTSVAVRCTGDVRWSVYVRAAISSDAEVLVARGAMLRGTEPVATDFERVMRTVPGSGAEYPADPAALHGLRLRTTLAAGEVLTRGKLETAALVHRGQKVTLLARDAGFEIRVAAVALADGRPAERIPVQNENSHQVVQAMVRDATLVEVGL